LALLRVAGIRGKIKIHTIFIRHFNWVTDDSGSLRKISPVSSY
jgi:hypothetical protein